MDADRLRSFPLFSGLSKAQLRWVAQHADEVDLEEGTRLVREGEFSYEFFAIEEGAVEVRHDGEQLAELGPGDFFGEMGLMAHGRRNADVIVTEPTTAIVMTGGAFRQMGRDMPAVTERVRSAIEERCRALIETG